MTSPGTDLAEAGRVLTSVRTIAVLGAHRDPARPAHYVPAYLAERGYRIVAVNPRFVGEPLFGAPTLGSLAAAGPVDMVDVFRPAAALPGHLDDLLAMDPLPKVVWLQLGIRHEAVAEALRARGIQVVQDRCALADHRALGLP